MTEDQGITIKLLQKPKDKGDPPTTYNGDESPGGKQITVIKSEVYSNFYRYTHTLQNGGGQFKLLAVLDDKSNPIDKIQKAENLISVSAYYWRHENGTQIPSKALLVQVTTKRNKYYANVKNNGSNEWIVLTGGTQPPFIYGDLERTLDDLVCSNYDAVTMDISHDASSDRARRREPYCCRCHDKGASGIDKRKVSVTKGKIQAGSKPLDYYKHDISGRNSRLAGIKYYPKGYDANTPSQRRRIKLGDKAFPLSNTQAVYAFHCGGNPVLIYVSSSQEDVKGWYKPNTTGDNVTWQRVSGISKDPDNIKDCNGSDFDALVEELVSAGCRIYSTCKELQSQSPQKRGASPSGPSGPPSSRLTASPDEVGEKDVAAVYAKAETGASGAEQEQQDSVARSENFGGTDQDGEGEKAFYSSDGRPTEALPALQSATTDDQTASPGTPEAPPQPFAAAPVATSLWLTFGSTSATLAGAGGLTGLGWWAFKRSKGDPWVRQI